MFFMIVSLLIRVQEEGSRPFWRAVETPVNR
jgi:hypothetical protein